MHLLVCSYTLVLDDLCAEASNNKIRVIFKNTLPDPVVLHKITENGATEMVPKDFDGDGHLILEADKTTKYLFKKEDGGDDLTLCLGNHTDVLFKGSHFGVTCEKTVLVRIVKSCGPPPGILKCLYL